MPAKKKTSLTIRINDVKLNYVHLIKPGKDLDGNLKYMAFLSFPEDHPQIDDILTTIETIADANGLDYEDDSFKNPLRSYKGYDSYPWLLPSKQLEVGELGLSVKAPYDEDRENNGQPVLVDAKRNFINTTADIYSGCVANVSLSFYPFSGTAEGVAVGLRGVQVTYKGERLDGVNNDPDTMFEEVEGFVSERGFVQPNESNETEEEIKPKRTRKSRTKTKTPVEPEEEIKPKRTRKSRTKTKPTNPIEMEEEKEEEEEEVKPKRRTRKTAAAKNPSRKETEIEDIFDEDDLI